MSKNYVNSIARILLMSVKIFENRLYCVVYSIILMSCGIISIFGSIIGFYNNTEISEKIVAFVCVTAQLNGILLYIAVLIYRKRLLELFDELKKKRKNIDEILNRTEVFIKNKLIWFFATVIISGMIFIAPALIVTIFQDEFGDKNSILIPFWYSCGGRNSNGILCWNVPSATRITVHGINIYVASSLSIHMFAYLLSFTLYGLVAGDLDMHMEIIRRKVDRFNKLAEESEVDEDSCFAYDGRFVEIEETLYREFLHIIKYQKFVYR